MDANRTITLRRTVRATVTFSLDELGTALTAYAVAQDPQLGKLIDPAAGGRVTTTAELNERSGEAVLEIHFEKDVEVGE